MNHCCQYGVIISRFLLDGQQILNFDFEPLSIFGESFKQCLLCAFFNPCESDCDEMIKNLLADNLSMLLVSSFPTLLFLGMKVKSLNDLIETIDFIVCDRVLRTCYLWNCLFNESLLLNWNLRGGDSCKACLRYCVFNNVFKVPWEVYKQRFIINFAASQKTYYNSLFMSMVSSLNHFSLRI